MAETDGLEPQQFQKQYWEDDVPLRDVRKSVWRRFVYLGVALFVLFVFVGSLVKFPDEVQLPFVLKADKSEDIYRFPYPVYVVEKYAAAGAVVRKGMPLAKISSPEIVQLIVAYKEAEQNLANYSGQQVLSVDKQRQIIGIRIAQNEGKMRETQRALATLDSIWSSNHARLMFEKEEADRKLEKNKSLYAGKYISSQELKDYEARSLQAGDALVTAKQQYEKDKTMLNAQRDQYILEVASLTQERGKTSIDSRFDSVKYADQLQLATGKIRNTFGDFEISDGGLILRANEDGVMSFVADGDKEVQSGAVLMKMQYSKAMLYSLVYAPPSLVGKLQKDQKTFLKVATFPSYEWGAVAGHVDNVSLTPDEKGNFIVSVALDDFRKMKSRLQAGMNGSATIVLDERTFFEYFFRDVKRRWSDATMNN